MLEGPHQVKSAIGNVGTFDPSSPDIAKAEGGAVDIEGKLNNERQQIKNSRSHLETSTTAERFSNAGRVRGGSGVLQASIQADPAAPLTGLPVDIAIPPPGKLNKSRSQPSYQASCQ
jgi:hypothetical protein